MKTFQTSQNLFTFGKVSKCPIHWQKTTDTGSGHMKDGRSMNSWSPVVLYDQETPGKVIIRIWHIIFVECLQWLSMAPGSVEKAVMTASFSRCCCYMSVNFATLSLPHLEVHCTKNCTSWISTYTRVHNQRAISCWFNINISTLFIGRQ